MKEKTKIKDSDNIKPLAHDTLGKPHTPLNKKRHFFTRWQSASVTILTISMVLSLFIQPILSIFAEDTAQRCILFKGKQISTQKQVSKHWVGEKIVFLPDYHFDYEVCYCRSEEDINWATACMGFAHPSTLLGLGQQDCPSKEQLAGKTAEIVRIIEETFSTIKGKLFHIVFRLEESETLLYSTLADPYYLTLPQGTTLLSYMEKGKSYVGKIVWSKQTMFLGSTKYAAMPYVRNLEKLTVVDVRWGPLSAYPLDFYLENSDGEIGKWGGSPIKENVLFNQVFDGVFDEEWYLTDPHKLHPNWSQKVWRAIEKREVYIGMTKEMVLMSWGKPEDVNRTIGRWGVHEQWVYGSQYLYFENDKLTTIQD